eukprot:g11417.t1
MPLFFYHPSSSASLRILLALRLKKIESIQEVVVKTFLCEKGIPRWELPTESSIAKELGTTDWLKFNPEGRVPVYIENNKMMTQTTSIFEYIEETYSTDNNNNIFPLLPADPWLRAESRRIASIVAADIQPYQNLPFLIQAVVDFDMKGDLEQIITHPMRQHFIRREFTALEEILNITSNTYCVGDAPSMADCYLVPQVRNALGANINIKSEFPTLYRTFENCLNVPEIHQTLIECGGIVQPTGRYLKK